MSTKKSGAAAVVFVFVLGATAAAIVLLFFNYRNVGSWIIFYASASCRQQSLRFTLGITGCDRIRRWFEFVKHNYQEQGYCCWFCS